MALQWAMAKRAGGPSGCTDSPVHKCGAKQSTSVIPVRTGLVPNGWAKTPGDSSRARATSCSTHAASPMLRRHMQASLQPKVWHRIAQVSTATRLSSPAASRALPIHGNTWHVQQGLAQQIPVTTRRRALSPASTYIGLPGVAHEMDAYGHFSCRLHHHHPAPDLSRVSSGYACNASALCPRPRNTHPSCPKCAQCMVMPA